jgi:integral membrane sensor domain MASE1
VGALDRPLADLGLRRRVALSVPFLVPAVAAVAGSDLVLTFPRILAKAVAAIATWQVSSSSSARYWAAKGSSSIITARIRIHMKN